jgi:tetratricopeptide (TPR) repeat protein
MSLLPPSRTTQPFASVTGFLFLVVLSAVAILYLAYPWPVFTWQQLQELQPQEIPLYAFERGNLEFTIAAENYLLFERWLGNPIEPNVVALDVYLIGFALGLSGLLALVSTLSRFWFYVGSTVTAFVVALFRWDSLLLFDSSSRYIGIVVVGAFLAKLFYFQFFGESRSFTFRYFSFVILSGAIGILTWQAGEVAHPLRMLAVNTLPAAIILALIFVIVIAHQLLASFVTLAHASSRRKSFGPFILISGIYLLNLWLAYANRIGWIPWEYTIPSFLLLAVSGFLTVWTISQREPLYEGLFGDYKLLLVFIVSLGTIALATYGYFLASSNDVALLSLNDLILYAHIGYGMMFVAYVLANFLGVFEQGLAVDRVLYKPTTMPYFSYRFAGLIFTLALVFYNNWPAHVNHFTSAFYTALGDTYYDIPAGRAPTFYRRAHSYAPFNQHAATLLAQIEASELNTSKERQYLLDANRFRPTEFTLLNADQFYLSNGYAYEEIQLLRRAWKLFPNSGIIENNLGLAFSRVGMGDSAAQHLARAAKDAKTATSAGMNLLAVLAKSKTYLDADSVYRNTDEDNAAVRSNALALANHQGKYVDAVYSLPADSLFNLFTATLVSNLLTNHTNQSDTAYISQCVAMARKPYNNAFRHLVLTAAAKACYASGQVNKAVELMQQVVFLRIQEGPANYTLGLMMLDQGKPDAATTYFQYAIDRHSSPASLAVAVSLAETGRLDEALIAWDTLSQRKDSVIRELGESMKRVLGAPQSWLDSFSDAERLYFALYRVPITDTAAFDRLASKIKNEDLRAKAYLNRARQYFAVDEVRLAASAFRHLQGLHLTDTELFAEIKYFELRLLAAQGRTEELQKAISQGILFGPYHEHERIYYEGLISLAAGDTATTRQRFEWLARNNWYFDEGIVTAARYSINDLPQAYRILSDALQVNPRSVKILKSYIPVALARGFDPFASDALATLRELLSPAAFQAYVKQNQLTGLLAP